MLYQSKSLFVCTYLQKEPRNLNGFPKQPQVNALKKHRQSHGLFADALVVAKVTLIGWPLRWFTMFDRHQFLPSSLRTSRQRAKRPKCSEEAIFIERRMKLDDLKIGIIVRYGQYMRNDAKCEFALG